MEDANLDPNPQRSPFPEPAMRLAVPSPLLARLPHLDLLCGGIPRTGFAAWGEADALLTFAADRRTLVQRRLEAKYISRHFLTRTSPLRLPAIGRRRYPPLGLLFDRPSIEGLSPLDDVVRTPAREASLAEAGSLLAELREIWRKIDAILDPGTDVSSRIILLEPAEAATPALNAVLETMIEQALAAHEPGALLLYGPQAGAGVLAHRFRQRGLAIKTYSNDNIGVLARAKGVWTCGGDSALEAILAGARVRRFEPLVHSPGEAVSSAPEGLVKGILHPEATPLHLAWETLIAASRYADPVHKERTDAHGALDRLHSWSRLLHRHYLPGRTTCVGIPKWKQPMLEAHLMAEEFDFAATAASVVPKAGRLAQWSYPVDPRARSGSGNAISDEPGVSRLFIEDGFLRSAGFGSDFHFPLSLTLDRKAMHFDGLKASDLETILAETRFSGADIERARELRHAIVEGKLTKYNLPQEAPPPPQADGLRQVVLIAGQVPGDAAVLHGAAEIRTALDLVKAVRALHPDAYVIFREHPELVAGNRSGRTDQTAVAPYIDEFVTEGGILEDIQRADEVHAITSLAGFEALLRNRKVVCWGRPFYAGWGLTTDMTALPRRTRSLTLDELVAGALLIYPSYVDPDFAIPCTAGDVVKILIRARANPAEGTAAPALSRRLASSMFAPFWRYITLSCRLGNRFYWLKRSP